MQEVLEFFGVSCLEDGHYVSLAQVVWDILGVEFVVHECDEMLLIGLVSLVPQALADALVTI